MHASNHSPAFFYILRKTYKIFRYFSPALLKRPKTTFSFIASCMVAVPSVFCQYLALLTLPSRISQTSSCPDSTLAGYEAGGLTLFYNALFKRNKLNMFFSKNQNRPGFEEMFNIIQINY